MGLSTATLNGNRVTHARVTIPAWGCWYADVTIDGEISLSGAVTLVVADLTLKGTVLSGGPGLGRSMFRIVGGAGGWGKVIASKAYANDAGTKVSKVIGDAASDAGETFVSDSNDRVGSAWTRQNDQAVCVLNLIAPRAWYVDEAGVTRLGARAAGALVGQVTRVTPADLSRGKVVLASDAIATILPGLVVDGITAVDVLHELDADSGLRSTVWGREAGSPIDTFGKLIAQIDPDRNFRGVTEYRIDTRDGALLNVQPVRASSGMPYLKRVPVWPGIPGCSQTPPLGSRVLVGFIDSDPSRPYATAFEEGAASAGLRLITDGLGVGGHAITAEQVLGLFAQYTAARAALSADSAAFTAIYLGSPQATLAAILLAMTAGAVAPAPIGPLPGGDLTLLGLPALVSGALALQLPDPASIGLPVPVLPGLAKKDLRL